MAAVTAAVAGLAISATSAGISFAQANKQKKKQEMAEKEADQAMEAARGKLDVNFAEQMSIKKEAYDLEREALLVQGAMATQAGVESERGSAATAGRIYAGQQQGQAGVRSAMADEMTNIESAIIEEDARLRDLDVALDLEEVAGNQQKAADAERAAMAAKQAGIEATISAAGQAVAMAPMFKSAGTGAKKMAAAAGNKPGAAGGGYDMQIGSKKANMFNKGQQQYFGKNVSDLDFGSMSNKQFRQFNRALTPEQQFKIMSNPDYINQMNQNMQNQYQYFGYNPGSF